MSDNAPPPQLTTIHVTILACTHPDWKTGREIRAEVVKFKTFSLSAPAFYMHIGYLASLGFVERKQVYDEINGHEVTVNMYRRTEAGVAFLLLQEVRP